MTPRWCQAKTAGARFAQYRSKSIGSAKGVNGTGHQKHLFLVGSRRNAPSGTGQLFINPASDDVAAGLWDGTVHVCLLRTGEYSKAAASKRDVLGPGQV